MVAVVTVAGSASCSLAGSVAVAEGSGASDAAYFPNGLAVEMAGMAATGHASTDADLVLALWAASFLNASGICHIN